MGRPIYTYELADPDFSWLISNFKENNPQHVSIESSNLPIVFISSQSQTTDAGEEKAATFELPPCAEEIDTNSELVGRK